MSNMLLCGRYPLTRVLPYSIWSKGGAHEETQCPLEQTRLDLGFSGQKCEETQGKAWT